MPLPPTDGPGAAVFPVGHAAQTLLQILGLFHERPTAAPKDVASAAGMAPTAVKPFRDQAAEAEAAASLVQTAPASRMI
jgi:hypothetical protein